MKMKKSRFILTSMIFAFTILVSCEKEKEENNTPEIISQPSDLNVFIGDSDDNNQLVVIASDEDGDDLSYQWQKYVDNVWSNIDGANNSNYIPDKSNVGTVDYKVTISDGVSSVTSDIATVTVNSNPPTKVFDAMGYTGWGLLWSNNIYYCGNQNSVDNGPNVGVFNANGDFESFLISNVNYEFTGGLELYEEKIIAVVSAMTGTSIVVHNISNGEFVGEIDFQTALENYLESSELEDLYPQDIAYQNGQWYMSANKDGDYSCVLLLDIDFGSGAVSITSEKKPGGGAENGLHYTGITGDGSNIWLNGGSEILKLDENCDVIKSYPEPMINFNIYGLDYDANTNELICYSKGHIEDIPAEDVVETVYRWKPE